MRAMLGTLRAALSGAIPIRPARRRGAALAAAALLMWLTPGGPVRLAGDLAGDGAAQAQPLVADLSTHLVAITTGFTGSDVLFFGAIEGKGDVVVVVQGPAQDVVVRRKDRVSGIWVNGASMTFTGVPTFYAVAATGPIDRIVPEALARQEEIGVHHLRFRAAAGEEHDVADLTAFRQALIRLKQREGTFPRTLFDVTLIGNRLFRADMHFPANLPTGTYTVRFFLLRDGRVVGGSSSPLYVNKTGISAEVAAFAVEQSIWYGILAILVAGFLGWVAAVIFRRD